MKRHHGHGGGTGRHSAVGRHPAAGRPRGAGAPAPTSARGYLVRLALDVPARGAEADDWRVRGLAELLLQACVTGDAALVGCVDHAAARVPDAAPRFAARLRELRAIAGRVPAGYPAARPPHLPATPAPGPAVQAAAVAMARFADAYAPQGRSEEAPWMAEPRQMTGAAQISAMLDRLAPARAGTAMRHRCVPATALTGLIWRGWFLDGTVPTLAVAPEPHTPTAAAMMYGLHAGVHLDHLSALAREGRASSALRLQFGGGLLIAEAVAMTSELIGLAGSATLTAAQRSFLHSSLIDRLARLPLISAWGPRAAPGSPAMLAAATRASCEFATLPTLAAAYVAGPFRLAAREFRHPLIPAVIGGGLSARWPRVEQFAG